MVLHQAFLSLHPAKVSFIIFSYLYMCTHASPPQLGFLTWTSAAHSGSHLNHRAAFPFIVPSRLSPTPLFIHVLHTLWFVSQDRSGRFSNIAADPVCALHSHFGQFLGRHI